MMHRSRLHAALAALVPADRLVLGAKLAALDRRNGRAELAFTDGRRVAADVVIGADGIHSVVREALFGADRPRYIGKVAYRTTYPTARLAGHEIDGRCKWWGPNSHLLHYHTTRSMDEIYFIAVTPEPDFSGESWSARGDRDALLAAFEGYHPTVLAVIAAAEDLRKWALVERDPMPRWGEEGVILLGDACHAMMPFMAQGAAMAIEDAVVLGRVLAGVGRDGVTAALRRYEDNRRERTARIQLTNRQNTWLRQRTDTDWVYEYDAWTVPLAG